MSKVSATCLLAVLSRSPLSENLSRLTLPNGKRTGYLFKFNKLQTSSSPVNLHFSFPPYSILMATGNLGCVVVAVDGSEESMKALQWALDNLRLRPGGAASEEGGEVVEPGVLVVLHVQSPPSIAAGLNPGPIPFGGPSEVDVPAFYAAIEAHQRRITQAIMDHALKICEGKGVNVKTEVIVGDPKEKICEAAANLKADLLVMGCRAIGPIKRMFLGSVSNYCVNHVCCPVVVMKDA